MIKLNKYHIVGVISFLALGSFLYASGIRGMFESPSQSSKREVDPSDGKKRASFGNTIDDPTKQQQQRLLDEEREKNKQLEGEKAELIKRLSEILGLHLRTNQSVKEIITDIQIRLNDGEHVPKLLTEDEISFVEDMTSDEPNISKRITQYHIFIKSLKGKRIIILEDNNRED